jgi:hypothetical protein
VIGQEHTKAKPVEVAACTLNRLLHDELEVALTAETALGSVRVRITALEAVEFVEDGVDAFAVRHTLAGPDVGLFQGFKIGPQDIFLVLAVIGLIRKHVAGRHVKLSVQDGAETAASGVKLFCVYCQYFA